jgi:hypothetical protein
LQGIYNQRPALVVANFRKPDLVNDLPVPAGLPLFRLQQISSGHPPRGRRTIRRSGSFSYYQPNAANFTSSPDDPLNGRRPSATTVGILHQAASKFRLDLGLERT